MLVAGEDIASFCETLRRGGKKIVFTNGCFDILHAGHVRYLAAARALGDCLVLGLNTDASVRRIKGPERPINSETDRAEVADALKAVDYVVLFDEPTAEQVIGKVRPDIYVKGGDTPWRRFLRRKSCRAMAAGWSSLLWWRGVRRRM